MPIPIIVWWKSQPKEPPVPLTPAQKREGARAARQMPRLIEKTKKLDKPGTCVRIGAEVSIYCLCGKGKNIPLTAVIPLGSVRCRKCKRVWSTKVRRLRVYVISDRGEELPTL